jgi:hypothetical protein
LEEAIADRKLFDLRPLPFPGDETIILEGDDLARRVYVSPAIMAAIEPPFPNTKEGLRRGEFRAWLDAFMLGAEISVCEDPDLKPPQTDFARVKPVEADFWSIRVLDPSDTAGLRSIGAFHDKNEFIALRWDYREKIDDFDAEVDEARLDWRDIFNALTPHQGDWIHEYLTGVMAYETRRG